MSGHISHQPVTNFLRAALECSIYHAPTDPGLTYEELIVAGERADFMPGEINDALPHIITQTFGGGNRRLQLSRSVAPLLMNFIPREDPDYRNVEAFDFVFEELRQSARMYGEGNAKIERSVIVERAVSRRLPRLDVEAAITIMLMNEILTEKDSVLSFASGKAGYGTPGDQLKTPMLGRTIRKDARARAYPIVKDIIARRTDGRPKSPEPLAAFADELEKLGYGPFRLWWTQLVAEYKQTTPQTASVMATVLAAALVEGALTFVVQHARSRNLPPFRSDDFKGEPRSWRLDKLIASAASGGEAAILDQPTRLRAEGLNQTRQRIHAGRMLSDFPNGPADLKPEQARDAQTTADLVVGHVIEWLQKYPVVSDQGGD
jgi:hypothetical protein